jgi:hypothetical protein
MDAAQHFSNNKAINPNSIKVGIEIEMEASFRLVNAPILPGAIADRSITITGAALVDAQRWVANKAGKHLLLETSEGVMDVPCRIANSGQVALLSTLLNSEGSPIEQYYASSKEDADYSRLVARMETPPTKEALDNHFARLVQVKAVQIDKNTGQMWFSSIGQGRYQLSQLAAQLYMAARPAVRTVNTPNLDMVDAFEA